MRRIVGSREVDFGGFGAPGPWSGAGCVDEGQLGGDLDAAAALGVEAGVEDVGANVLLAFFHQGEMSHAAVESSKAFAIQDCCG